MRRSFRTREISVWNDSDGVPRACSGGEHGGALFHGTVDAGRGEEAMPMHQFWIGAVVGDGDGDGLAFAEAEQ